MKFVRFGGGKTGLVIEADGLKVLDVGGSLGARCATTTAMPRTGSPKPC